MGFKTKYESRHLTVGFGEIGASAYSGALSKDIFKNNLIDLNGSNFDFGKKMQAASLFTNKKVAYNETHND